MITITLLADRLDTIPTLTTWFCKQWPDHFNGRSQASIADEFRSEANRKGLPLRLVAFADGELAGTVCLRERAFDKLPDYQPGIGGLLVIDNYRNRGIGTELMRASMEAAHKQGFSKVYATTVNAKGVLKRLGWTQVQMIEHDDEQLGLYRFDFNN